MTVFPYYGYSNYRPPHPGRLIPTELPGIPSLPNLISQFLINQQGFDVGFGEHGWRMELSWPRLLALGREFSLCLNDSTLVSTDL